MKTKLVGLALGLALYSLTAIGQETPPTNSPSTPETPPAEPALGPAETPAPPGPGTPAPPATNDVPAVATNDAPAVATNAAPALDTNATPALDTNATPAVATSPNAAEGGTNVIPAVAGENEIIPLIQIEDVPLTDAIRNLTRMAGINFQFDPRVMSSNQPNISIRFEKVTAQEALHAVLENYNLVLSKDPKSKIARVTLKDPKAEDPLVAKIIQLMYADPTNMVAMIKPTLSARSQVLPDSRTSQLIVTTTEKEMDAVTVLIAKLDTPTKQVLIEANIFETARNPTTVKGIDWSGTLEAQHLEFGNNTPDIQIARPGTPATPSPDGITPGTPAVPGTPAIFGRNFAGPPRLAVNTKTGFYPPIGFLNGDGVSAVLSFLNKDNDTEVVATPRAVTLDNQTAVLSITRAFPVFLITPGSANTAAGAQINYTNLGTTLHVTPRIAADNNIALRLVPEVSNLDGVDKKVIQNTVNEANIYAIRRIETSVMIPSGTTLVMGGLINDTSNKNWTKVPILGDLPVLGWAFRKEGKSRNKSNLLIFVTPTIVDEGAFQMTSSGTEFLRTRLTERPEETLSAWDSGKPHDWTKPVY